MRCSKCQRRFRATRLEEDINAGRNPELLHLQGNMVGGVGLRQAYDLHGSLPITSIGNRS
jgi:hypothetical protein